MNLSDLKIKCSYSKIVKTESLKPHPDNPNQHSETQVTMLADLIRTVGWRYPIIVSKRSGFIVSGHARLMAAQRLNLDKVPVDFQDYDSDEDELLQLLGDNKLPELAQRDKFKEAVILDRLRSKNVNTILAGYKPKELDEILKKAQSRQQNKQEDVIPEMEIYPHEHYDYIVLFFRNDYDWVNALQIFGVENVKYGASLKNKRIGLGRVIDGARVLQKFFNAKGDSQQGQVGDHNNSQADS